MTPLEFSRPRRLDMIGEGAATIAIEADAGERAALARRFGLIALDCLTADYSLRRDASGIVASGTLSATVVQPCIATGEPVPATIEEPFDIRFLPELGGDAAGEHELDEGDLDTMFYDGAAIDLGEAAAETLGLALAAAPRRAFVAVPAALLTVFALIEGASIAPRTGIVAALIVGLLLAIPWSRSHAAAADSRDPATIAADAAWSRLAASAGLLTRTRVAAIRRRRDLLLSRDVGIDPFSTFGELRIKLERRIPELIENYLDEAATAPAMRRHLLMTELLGEVERLVARTEAVDPTVIARDERRAALKNHLGSGSDRTPID